MNEEQKKAFGKQLKIARVWLNLQGSEVSEATGISVKQIWNIEANGSTGSVAKYLMFLRRKGIDLNVLFDKVIKGDF